MYPTAMNNPINPTPGLNSPVFWGSWLLGVGLLIFGKDDTDYDRAVYLLAISATHLLTTNTSARNTSLFGGAMRMCSSGAISSLGFFAQTAALCYAAKESIAALPSPFLR